MNWQLHYKCMLRYNSPLIIADERLFSGYWMSVSMNEIILLCIHSIKGHKWHIRLFLDDVTKWKHFPRHLPFARGIHRSPVNSPQKDQWRGALMFSLTCDWTNSWANSGDADDLRRYRANYEVIVMYIQISIRGSPKLSKALFLIYRFRWTCTTVSRV